MKEENNVGKADLKSDKFIGLIAEPIFPSSGEFATCAERDFEIPWVAYSFKNWRGEVVGYGGFSGPPKDGEVKIDHVAIPRYNHPAHREWIQECIYKELVEMAYKTHENLRVFARNGLFDLVAHKVLERSGFLPCYVLDNEFCDDVFWLHKKHLERLVPNLQAVLQGEEPVLDLCPVLLAATLMAKKSVEDAVDLKKYLKNQAKNSKASQPLLRGRSNLKPKP